MDEYLQAFGLGNAAIIGNVCMLPLYPGLFVMLASRAEQGTSARSLRWMGVLVLAGVLTVMVAMGGVLHLLSTTFADVLPYVLPIAYGFVALLGVAMVVDRNPFVRLSTASSPLLHNPAASAFLYGMALGPMTLPCTGPLVISAFVLGGVRGAGAFGDAIAYFAFFGLGFGWPLVALPFLAAPAQRRITGWLTSHHRAIGIASGLLLIGVAIFGAVVDLSAAT